MMSRASNNRCWPASVINDFLSREIVVIKWAKGGLGTNWNIEYLPSSATFFPRIELLAQLFFDAGHSTTEKA